MHINNSYYKIQFVKAKSDASAYSGSRFPKYLQTYHITAPVLFILSLVNVEVQRMAKQLAELVHFPIVIQMLEVGEDLFRLGGYLQKIAYHLA